MASGCAAEDERLGGGFRVGRAGGAGRAGVGVEDGAVSFVLFGIGAEGAAFFGIERARMGELVGRDPEAVRGGDFAEGDVSAAEVF